MTTRQNCDTCHAPRDLHGCTSEWLAVGPVVCHRGECRKPEPTPFVMTLPEAATPAPRSQDES